MAEETIYTHLQKKGVSRRDFMKLCGVLVGVMGLQFAPPVSANGLPDDAALGELDPVQLVAHALETKPRVPVIWLELQDCAGCTEALTRSQSPTLIDLVLNNISIEYQETSWRPPAFQAEQNKTEHHEKIRRASMSWWSRAPSPQTACIARIGGRGADDLLKEAAAGAAAIVATGNCAAFGGIPKAKPNPTGAKGVWEIIKDKPVVNIPGCPAIPEVFTGTLAQFLVFGALPELDSLHRPKTFYGNTIHDRCLRRPFYDAGKFATSFDDEGARQGWCLYKLGCKGPTTYNACATIKMDAGSFVPGPVRPPLPRLLAT